jgi:transketolase
MTLDTASLSRRAARVRRNLLEAIHAVGTGHAGSSLSAVELLLLLYTRHLRVRPGEPDWPERDRLVFSKGHGAPALYAVLAEVGYFPVEELRTLRQMGSRLHGHPVAGTLPGIDVSTGSLGQGLSIAVGMAAGFCLRGSPSRVFCVLGDGELQEGQNWEAIAYAAGRRFPNLVAVVDRNGLQNDGPTEAIHPLEDLAGRFEAFGWAALDVDGHDLAALDGALERAVAEPRPAVVVARTTKGKGVSFMEGVVKWHHHPVSGEELAAALREIGEG